MSRDEPVDGPKIAAEILNRMDSEKRERIQRKIEEKAPELSVKIKESLFDFNDLASLTPQGVQVLVAAVEQKDLVLSLKKASPQVKETLFVNMSERKAKLVKEDFESLPPVRVSDVEDAQKRIMKTLDELRSSGQIRTQSKNDLWV